jgi:hypothetical protein
VFPDIVKRRFVRRPLKGRVARTRGLTHRDRANLEEEITGLRNLTSPYPAAEREAGLDCRFTRKRGGHRK